MSPGPPQPECWVLACSPQWAQPAKSGLKKGFCGYKQTNKPALRTKGWHFFPIKSQKINTSVSVGHMASVVAGQLCCGRTAAADTHGRGRPFPSKAGLSRTGRGQCADPALEEWASSGTQAQPERRSLPCLPCGADRKHTKSAKETRAARDRGRQVGTLPSSACHPKRPPGPGAQAPGPGHPGCRFQEPLHRAPAGWCRGSGHGPRFPKPLHEVQHPLLPSACQTPLWSREAGSHLPPQMWAEVLLRV